MPDGDDVGDVFAIPDFFQQSKWLDEKGISQVHDDFFSLKLEGGHTDFSCWMGPDRNAIERKRPGVFRFAPVENHDFFALPAQESPDPVRSTAVELPNSSQGAELPESDGVDHVEQITVADDLWLHLGEPVPPAPEFKTWDRFNRNEAQPRPMYITEAGPGAFDALIGDQENPTKIWGSQAVTVDAGAYCNSLLSLALGRESVLFSWHDPTQSFKPTMPKIRVTGYTEPSLQGVVAQCLECGNASVILRNFVDSTYATPQTPCRVALASAIDKVLLVVQGTAVVADHRPRSILQLQSLVRRISIVVLCLQSLVTKSRECPSDEALVATMFRQAQGAEYGDVHLRAILREVLQRVARPWLDFLEEWIGTKPEIGAPLSQGDAGRQKGFIRVEAQTFVDDLGDEVEDLDFRLDWAKVPGFMPDDLVKTAFETGRSLRFIRSSHPQHGLAQPDASSTEPPTMAFRFDWDTIHDTEQNVRSYERALMTKSAKGSSTSPRTSCQFTEGGDEVGYEIQMFSTDEKELQRRLLESMKCLSQPKEGTIPVDPLTTAVTNALAAGKAATERVGADFAPHWSLLPTLSFGSMVLSQSRVVGRESLKLLFTAHNLREHLNLQRDFQLCGNGIFCSRLSHALFDPDMETAERQTGVARQGGVMGLRLGGRDTWPPASSELRLALMGVLVDSHNGTLTYSNDASQRRPGQAGELPGDLSFGVRDLSSEEIDKCLDPDGLEALDFLRLAYKAPPALASVITPSVLMRYDRVFRLLLRVLRMQDTVHRLFLDVTGRGKGNGRKESEGESIRFCFEARHFLSGLTTYMFEVGIGIPWSDFERKLNDVEAQIFDSAKDGHKSEAAPNPDRLRDYHSHVLDRIMSALLLRKRQQPIMKLLEEIFKAILRFAKYVRLQAQGTPDPTGPTPSKLYRSFRRNVEVFLTVCRAVMEKGGGTTRKEGDGRHDVDDKSESLVESPMAQLLLKLDMFHYYTKDVTV